METMFVKAVNNQQMNNNTVREPIEWSYNMYCNVLGYFVFGMAYLSSVKVTLYRTEKTLARLVSYIKDKLSYGPEISKIVRFRQPGRYIHIQVYIKWYIATIHL